jgi:hypothetical protein
LAGTLSWLVRETLTLARLLAWWPAWAAVAVLAVVLVFATQRPVTLDLDVGSPRDEAFVRIFHTRLEESGANYRWSDVYGYIALPGVGGSRPFTLGVTLDVPRPAPVTVIVNGETLFEEEVTPGWQTISVPVDETHAAALASRDLVMEIRAPEYRDPSAPAESRGVRVDRLTFQQSATGGFIWPALAPLVWLCAALLALYLLVARALWGLASNGRARMWGTVAATIGAAGAGGAYTVSRVDVAAGSGQVLACLLTGLVLLVIGERLLAGMSTQGVAGHVATRAGAVALAVAFVLRFGGMGLPQAVIIDMPWHMKWLTTLLAGNWQALYFPGGLSSVPAEWGLELLIPKSPLFYVVAAPLAVLPFDLETLVKWLTCLLDSSVVLLAYWFVRRLGAGYVAAASAAVLYALMPLAYRAFAYGILPTIFAQWLAALLFAVVLAQCARPPNAAGAVGTVVLAALTIVAFPTIAVFVTLVLLGYALVLLRPAYRRERRRWLVPLGTVIAGGWVIAVVAYYGLYIEPVVASAQALLVGGQGTSSVRWPGGPPELLAWTADYVVTLLPLLLACAGLAVLWGAVRGNTARLALALVVLWLAILPVFLVVNYRMDMIGKHLFFTMVPIAVLGGVTLSRYWRRRRWGMPFAALLVVVVGWQGLVFWVERLVRASS